MNEFLKEYLKLLKALVNELEMSFINFLELINSK